MGVFKNMFHQHIKGLCRGIVEDAQDPEGYGRVRVRIPSMHGIPDKTKHALENDELPWAYCCVSSAGPGRGSATPPNKGDIAWIGFEDGKKDKPVVLGYTFSPACTNSKKPQESSSMETQPETPSESIPQGVADKGGAGQIIYKSKKGAEIGFYDETEKETFRIIDSIGQVIEFGGQSPSGTPARSNGDRTRKPVKPEGKIHGKGYINIQIAADPEEGEEALPDPKFSLAPNTLHIENGTSKISAEKDHISIHNGTSAIDINKKDIKMSNTVSSIDMVAKDSEVNESKKETLIMTNGSGVSFLLQGEDLTITAKGDIKIVSGGNIYLN